MTELARQTGVPKQSLYKNPNIRSMLEVATEARGVKATRGVRQVVFIGDRAAFERAVREAPLAQRRRTAFVV
jgi:hypothetical protein